MPSPPASRPSSGAGAHGLAVPGTEQPTTRSSGVHAGTVGSHPAGATTGGLGAGGRRPCCAPGGPPFQARRSSRRGRGPVGPTSWRRRPSRPVGATGSGTGGRSHRRRPDARPVGDGDASGPSMPTGTEVARACDRAARVGPIGGYRRQATRATSARVARRAPRGSGRPRRRAASARPRVACRERHGVVVSARARARAASGRRPRRRRPASSAPRHRRRLRRRLTGATGPRRDAAAAARAGALASAVIGTGAGRGLGSSGGTWPLARRWWRRRGAARSVGASPGRLGASVGSADRLPSRVRQPSALHGGGRRVAVRRAGRRSEPMSDTTSRFAVCRDGATPRAPGSATWWAAACPSCRRAWAGCRAPR